MTRLSLGVQSGNRKKRKEKRKENRDGKEKKYYIQRGARYLRAHAAGMLGNSALYGLYTSHREPAKSRELMLRNP